MKFYLASGLQNKQPVNYVSEKLLEAGCVLTYDWTKNDRALRQKKYPPLTFAVWWNISTWEAAYYMYRIDATKSVLSF